jgi:SAM-dependent methyltransferase
MSLRKIFPPPKYYYPKKYASQLKKPFILDIGSGNHSPSKAKFHFPDAYYAGVDLDLLYNYTEADKNALDEFHSMDISKCDFSGIEDNKFDIIIMAHIIEHIPNGEDVLKGLIPKLKKGGIIYIEFPGKKSLTLPSMNGTLNFYDDNTHARVYSFAELSKYLETIGMKTLQKGVRRYIPYLLITPIILLRELISGRKYYGPPMWDLMGFAELVVAKKVI